MESKVNPAAVGAFVLLLAAAGVGALLWLGSGRLSQKTHETYLAFFSDSVSGLNVRAPVKLRGVEVGAVDEIALDPNDPGRVRVVLSIEKGTPVKEDTYATLGVQGLTGIAYVELGGGSRLAAALRPGPGEALPVIQTRPSIFTRLDLAATSLLGDFDYFTKGMNETLDADTRQALRSSAQDLARITRALGRRSREIDASMVAATELLENGARASAALPRLVERLGRSADAVERMGDELARAGTAAHAAVQGARGAIEGVGTGVEQLRTEVIPDVQRLIAELRETSASVGRISAEVERDPSALVLGRARPPPGPGE
jgi:phospholipid/cholesterol/gamma-HCH transport system substrate-binding protein